MFNEEQQDTLLSLARDSIDHGLDHAVASPLDASTFAEDLRQQGACFVTLHLQGRLRGCIGSLEARRPLVSDVVENAYAAAFRDPRFAPLQRAEFGDIVIDISVLTPPEVMHFHSEQDLLARLEPGIDGLVLQSGFHKGTFLPSVWEQLPEPQKFLQHLKLKAGLGAEDWPEDIKISRYRTQSFSEQIP